MPLHVDGYTRKVNGKLIRVGAYDADRAQASREQAQKDPDRPSLAAQQGSYGMPGTGRYPNGRDTPHHFPTPLKNPPQRVQPEHIDAAPVGTKLATASESKMTVEKHAKGWYATDEKGQTHAVSPQYVKYLHTTQGLVKHDEAGRARGDAEGSGRGDGSEAPAEVRVGAGGRPGGAEEHHAHTAGDVKPTPLKQKTYPTVLDWAAHSMAGVAPKDVTQSEMDAASLYQDTWYDKWNMALRSNDHSTLDDQDQQDIAALTALIGRTKTGVPTTVWRGMNPNLSDHQDSPWLRALKPGSTLTDAGFTSTTTDSFVADRLFTQGIRVKIDIPQGSQALSLPALLKEDEEESEHEMLLAPGSRFKVLADTFDSGSKTRDIHLQLLPPDGQDEHGGVHHNQPVKLSAVLALSGLGQGAADAWKAAATKGLNHLVLVTKNNPKKPFSDILKRPDIQQALAHAGSTGADTVGRMIVKAWIANGGSADSPYLFQLVKDALGNGDKFAQRLGAALTGADHDELVKLMHYDQIRAAAGLSVAITRAQTEVALAQAKADGVTMMRWQTTSGNPCTLCQNLHGIEMPVGAAYDDGGKPVYFDLTGPPRHPNCQCILVPIT